MQRLQKLEVVYPNVKNIPAKNIWDMMLVVDEIWPWQFQLQLRPPTYGWELNDAPRNTVWVLQHCAVFGTKVSSPSQPVPFDDFVADLPTFSSSSKEGSSKKNSEGHFGKPESKATSSAEPPSTQEAQGVCGRRCC